MMPRDLPTACRSSPARRILRSVLILAILGCASIRPAGAAEEVLKNVALFVIPREALFFSVQGGTWTSVRLGAGERILERGADGNVAAVLTSERAIGFSALLNTTHEIRVTTDEAPDQFKVEGNVASFLTKLRALGFSAETGKWAEVQRFQPGR